MSYKWRDRIARVLNPIARAQYWVTRKIPRWWTRFTRWRFDKRWDY